VRWRNRRSVLCRPWFTMLLVLSKLRIVPEDFGLYCNARNAPTNVAFQATELGMPNMAGTTTGLSNGHVSLIF
jgi:hypothetical protein